MDPPFTKLDILCCRNLLIYLTPELQRKILPLFHYTLKPGGILFLGSSESIGISGQLFPPLAQKERIFRRSETGASSRSPDFPTAFVPDPPPHFIAPTPAPRSLQVLADQLLQVLYAPPAVLVTLQGDIRYINGRTGKYLEPAAGKANWNILAMVHENMRYDLANALEEAHRKKAPILLTRLKNGADADAHLVDLRVEPLDEPQELRGMLLVVFSETAPVPDLVVTAAPSASRTTNARQRELQEALRRARDELQSGREDMQTTQEELRSMNEELQSTNEELQSSNEELTTSKEEMQSLNEELQTVNTELQTKLDELSATNSDMKNLLNSTDIATVFLDNKLRVRRFTEQAKTIIKFIPGDLGRPLTDLASDLLYPELVADAGEVLRTLVFSEREINTHDGRWFTVRVMPYRTMDNRIDGLVITLANITVAKNLEARLRERNDDLTTKAAEQGRALGQAKDRLLHHAAKTASPTTKRAAKSIVSDRLKIHKRENFPS